MASAWVHMEQYAHLIHEWVQAGGRYLGFCLGGYLAGATPGFGLLPGDSARYISSRGAEIDTTDNTVIDVTWRGEDRSMFFQDGPMFVLRDGARTEVLARYRNGTIAAVVTDSVAAVSVSSVPTPRLTSRGTPTVSSTRTGSGSISVSI